MGQTLYEIWEKHGDSFCVIRQCEDGWEVWLGLIPTARRVNSIGETVPAKERSFDGERWTEAGSFGHGMVYESEAKEESWEHYKGSENFDPKADACACQGEGWVNIAHPVRPGVIAWRLPCGFCNESGTYPDPWPPPVVTVSVVDP